MSEPQLLAAVDTAAARFRQALDDAERAAAGFSLSELPEALGRIERLRAVLENARIEAVIRPRREAASHDQLLTASEAADRLRVSESWLYREAHRLPFTVNVGKALRFSEKGIGEYIRRRGDA